MKPSLTMLKRAVPLACASLLLVAGAAQATLQDRDLDGDTVVDAFYDTDLDITWLRNANGYVGRKWDNAVAWADGYSFAGYDDWRLPTSDNCMGANCTGSEMGHLWYLELGNTHGAMTNTGDFQDLLPGYYWSGTEQSPGPSGDAYYFLTLYGDQSFGNKDANLAAMVVTNGDVGMVPEPETYALMLAGLAGLALVSRRSRQR
jgi:hypothetical protein